MQQLSIFDDLLTTEIVVPFEVAEATPVAQVILKAFKPERRTPFFRMTDDVLDALTSPVSKVRANIKAVETAIHLRQSGLTASAEQRQALAAFTGWGGLSEVFAANTTFAAEQARLKSILTPEEYAQAQDSVLAAYFTEPMVIRSMWTMVRKAGFTGGAVIEPSCGPGHFIGCMPDDMREKSRVQMVEIDSITAAIAGGLYADEKTTVLNTGIEKCQYVGKFDLVIGNVPFGNYRVSDRRLDRLRLPVHEYFMAKALDMVRPGGLVALIVTGSMMDKTDSRVMPYLLQKASLLSAVRLPNGVFARLGGTDVQTDILLLQKRQASLDESELNNSPEAKALSFVHAPSDSCVAGEFDYYKHPAVNHYFASKPENVLGKFCKQRSRFGQTIGVKASVDWLQKLNVLAEKMPAVFNPAQNVGESGNAQVRRDPSGIKSLVSQGFFFSEDGCLMLVDANNDVVSQDHLPTASLARLEGMARIRDCVLRLMEADSTRQPHASNIRGELNALYDSFVKRHGFLLSPVNRRLFRADSHAPLLWSLERWDDEKEEAVKADVFFGSTVSVATIPEKAESVDDAVVLSYNKLGRMDVATVAHAMGADEDVVVSELAKSGRIFMNPATGEWEDSISYLSGNVRLKLETAKAALIGDQSMESNIKALEAVQPEWVSLDHVAVRLGVPWIPAHMIEDWLKDLFEIKKGGSLYWATVNVSHVSETATWSVVASCEKLAQFKSDWGTARKGFWDLLRALLNQQTPEIYDEIETNDGKTRRVINRDETLAAQEKAESIERNFCEWLMANEQAKSFLEREYNNRYNGMVNRTYDGSHMMIPGLNPQIKLRDAQKDSIWRGIVSGNTLYALAVGGGKTLIQICLAQESKRLGIANKPVLVVPNHMLEAFAGEYLRAFPRAKVLAASKDDFDGENRKTLLMRAATGNWDCIIMTHSTFGRIGLSAETIKAHSNSIKEKAREAVLGMSDQNVVREASRVAKSVEAKLESLTAVSRDSGLLPFEDLGIDMILVDEADLYKNLFFFTKKKRIPGISSAFSSRALDLLIKSRVVFDRRGDMTRGLVFSTATPISNSIGEMYVMQTYLQEERLRELDIDKFDAWSANFAREVTCVEVKPEGSGYRLHTRFARFVNVPELMLVFREIAEIRSKKMLGLPEPKLFGGGHEVIAVPPSAKQKAYVETLVQRAEAIRNGQVTPDEDNMLCVTGDGRKAALDMRCVDPTASNEPGSKVNVCAAKVFEIWERTKDQKLTQLVFCDLSVPQKNGFSVYEQIRSTLIGNGVPESEIAFAQDWDTDSKKGKLHRLVRLGQIRVLIGSTELMGFGTNVQDRLVAKHDLDAPWRPRDVEQRDGRIIRQGNINEVVHIYRYVTEQTFDAYMWQTLERKAAFIAQVMENDGKARSVEDVTSQSLSYAEVKALASGNPIVIEKAAVDAEVARLTAIKDVHQKDVLRHLRLARECRHDAQYLGDFLVNLKDWLQEARWDTQAVKVKGTEFNDLRHAAEAVMSVNQKVSALIKLEKNWSVRSSYDLMTVGNLALTWETAGNQRNLHATLLDGSKKSMQLDGMPFGADKIADWLKDGVLIQELVARTVGIEGKQKAAIRDADSYEQAANRVFEHEDRLNAALVRQMEINSALEIETDDKSAIGLMQA